MEVKGPLNVSPFQGLDVLKLAHTDAVEILQINLEAEALFPEHTSPTDAILIVLEGEVEIHIASKIHRIRTMQYLQFGAGLPHFVQASEDSRFLIIRQRP